jgi:hypothetical protein
MGLLYLLVKPTRCTNFSNLFLEWNSACLGQFFRPSSGVFQCTHSNGMRHTGLLTACQQAVSKHTIAVCTLKNSWWWTDSPKHVDFHSKNTIWEISASSCVPSWSCSQAVSKPVWHIPDAVCTVKNSWWWTEELSENMYSFNPRIQFEKLVHLVGFTIRNSTRSTVTWTSNSF